MKRSKMVKKIFKIIRTSKLITVEDDEICAEKILCEMEELGILPPEWKDPNPHSSERYNSRDSDWVFMNNGKYALRKNEWEPE